MTRQHQPREPRRDCELPEPRAAKRRLHTVLGAGSRAEHIVAEHPLKRADKPMIV